MFLLEWYYPRSWLIFVSTFSGEPQSLTIVLRFEEDRVSTYKELEFPFASMRRFVNLAADYLAADYVPEEFKELFTRPPALIEMKDGSLILVSSDLLVEIDSKGNQEITRPVKIDLFTKAEAESGYWLTGFIGRAETRSGEEGDFWIKRSEVQSIEFEGP